MVRKVHVCHDDELARFEPVDHRPAFDDLDDLILELPRRPVRRPRANAPSRRRPSEDPAPDQRRHLADADWLAPPRPSGPMHPSDPRPPA